jgi:hypothetical protein
MIFFTDFFRQDGGNFLDLPFAIVAEEEIHDQIIDEDEEKCAYEKSQKKLAVRSNIFAFHLIKNENQQQHTRCKKKGCKKS